MYLSSPPLSSRIPFYKAPIDFWWFQYFVSSSIQVFVLGCPCRLNYKLYLLFLFFKTVFRPCEVHPFVGFRSAMFWHTHFINILFICIYLLPTFATTNHFLCIPKLTFDDSSTLVSQSIQFFGRLDYAVNTALYAVLLKVKRGLSKDVDVLWDRFLDSALLKILSEFHLKCFLRNAI